MPAHRWSTKLLAHLEMMRPYTMFHAGLVAIAGATLASAGHAPAWRVALAAVVAVCGWEAGLYAGDYYDRELDARSKPERPVPSGRVSPREAFSTMVALIAAGYVAALALGPLNLALAIAATVLGIAYSKTFKNHALLGNFDRGVLGCMAALFGAVAVDHARVAALPTLLLLALVFFHDSATNLVGAMRDFEGDRAHGVLTVPVVYGQGRAATIACALAACWLAAACALLATTGDGVMPVVLVASAAALAVRAYAPLWRAGGGVTRAQALAAHKYLVAERLVLMSGVIALHAPVAAIALLIATLALTLGAQAALRDRYERQPGAGIVALHGSRAR